MPAQMGKPTVNLGLSRVSGPPGKIVNPRNGKGERMRKKRRKGSPVTFFFKETHKETARGPTESVSQEGKRRHTLLREAGKCQEAGEGKKGSKWGKRVPNQKPSGENVLFITRKLLNGGKFLRA